MTARLLPSRKRRRVRGSLLALLQLVAVIGAPAADLRLETAAAGMPLHIESEGNEDCPHHHDHLFCQAVRSLAASAIGSGTPALEAATQETRRSLPATSGEMVVPRTIIPGAAGPRAPPRV